MTTISKKQNLLTKFFAKNKPVESTDYETGLPDATLTEVQAKILMKVWVLKLKSVNSKMFRSQSFRGSLMIPITTLCIVMFGERQAQILLAKANLSLEKSLNVKVLFVIIKVNLKRKKCLFQCGIKKTNIPLLSIFCLIQGIYNYIKINTYWRYIVRIMASNIHLLVSKQFFLTSQGLAGAVMNCRALLFTEIEDSIDLIKFYQKKILFF